MRLLGRTLLAGTVTILLLVATGPGASAKPGEVFRGGRVVVTGPGLAAPIVLRGPDFEHVLTWIGPVVPSLLDPRCCVRFESPRPSYLGPRYEVQFELRYRLPRSGAHEAGVVTIRQDLYPYAPNAILHLPVPWTFTPPGQTVSVGHRTYPVDSRWIDSSLVFDLLVARGLPTKAPRAAVATVAGPAGSARPGGGPVMAMGLAALGAVLVGGALAGRRATRARRRTRS